ncbi:hybrid sensor histidine kinase/response regulator transcription factor [Fibrisoma limi]|nr:two-component regulator propeller domain-containing protein [Fibrisoma limi]
MLLWLCFLPLATAQPYVAWVKHYGPENGLSHREINAIFQDRQGFMWFGTKFGLNRFDGKTFTNFTKERNGLHFDDIHSIAQDADGNLWLGGSTGQSQIILFNPLAGKVVSFKEKFEGQLPSVLSNDLQGLLSSDNGTIFLTNYRPATLITYHPRSGLRSVSLPQFKTLGTFRATARNTVWALADENRIVELTADGRVLHQFSHGKDIVSWCLGQRNAGIEFFYTVYNPANTEHHTFYSVDELGRRREWPSALLESMKRYMGPVCYPVDRTGLLWDGISLRDSANRTVLTIAGQTAGETIENRSFYRDRNGLLWLGTSFGVYQVKLIQNHFQRLAYQENNKGEQGAAIRGITALGDQVFANLEKFGLYRIPQRGGEPQKLYGNSVFAYGIAHDAQGQIYAGNAEHVVHYNPSAGTYSTIKLPDGSAIWTFHPFGPDQWLAGSQKGLTWINTRTGRGTSFTKYNQFTELAQGHILHMAPDRRGTLWVCATTGLYTLDPQKGITARYWTGGHNGFHLPADSYQHFYQDSKGIYWLATANAGLIRWDRQQNQYRQFRRTEGLSNDNIYAVYPDRRGNLWMSSDYGIMRFDPVRQTTQTYFVQDGITHNEFNRVSHFQDKDGQIYFGGLNGITAFDPRNFESERPSAPLLMRMVSFRQFDQDLRQLVDKTEDVAKTQTITIRPDDQTAVLDFALLNYTDAEKNVYAYQFKDLDAAWTQQTESSLRLSNLPYGTHQLLIKGQASNGQWSANTLTIQVEVKRPFYLQIWFLILAALALMGGIWAWMQWRIWSHQQVEVRLQTEIRQATAQIEQDKELIAEQAQLLHRLNEAKSRFFANISHEFRTPLTVILGITSELKRYEPDELTRRVQRSSELIERNGRNLLRLINQILDLSKLEAGEMYLQPIQADLADFTRYLTESFHTMAAVKGIQLHFQSDEKALEADFDKDKLQDILSNLLTNALKFTPAGGHVSFQLTTHEKWSPLGESYYEAVSPTQHREEPWISVGVRNTGPGIDAHDLPHIFDRFYQRTADADRMQPIPETGGTGIGLSLVRELVVLMHGGLAVRSRPGEGAEFIIRLPHTQQAPVALIPVAGPTSTHLDTQDAVQPMPDTNEEKPVLLLVEDNEDVASYIVSCVQANYQIIRAENGQAGVELALDKIPDLILSDVMMPQKDGFQLCDELKNDPRTSHIPIVLLTAKAAASDRIAGLRRGADAYLTKPFHREELQVVLSNLLQSRRILQQHYSQLALATAPSDLPLPEETASLEDIFLLKLRSALEEQLTNTDLSIDELCHQMGMSRTTLHSKLVALTGMSISRYIRMLRLGKAKELLVSSGLNISQIAYAVGFEDPKYFSRVFSEEFGASPANFRRSVQSEQ